MRKKTVLVRMDKDLAKNLRTKFPKTNMSDLINVMYNTSPLKIEAALRKKKYGKKK